MNLIENATVTTGPASGWQRPEEHDNRSGAVVLQLIPVCPPGSPEPDPVVLMHGVGERVYETAPVVVEGALSGNTRCVAADDPDFLDQAIRDRLDLAVGASLVLEPLPGTSADAVWIGHPDAGSVPFTGNPLTASNLFADAVVSARSAWLRRTLGTPSLHLSADLVPGLLRAMLLRHNSSGVLRTALDDAVVVSEGYSEVDQPVAFWAGPIAVTISTVENTGAVHNARVNQVTQRANLLAVVDIAPGSIVRVAVTP